MDATLYQTTDGTITTARPADPAREWRLLVAYPATAAGLYVSACGLYGTATEYALIDASGPAPVRLPVDAVRLAWYLALRRAQAARLE